METDFNRLPLAVKIITRPVDLAMTAIEMGHRPDAYLNGRYLIVSILTKDGRSTVEVRKGRDGWYGYRHRGFRNEPPPPRHQALLEAWLSRENRLAS